jgi:hypothetical protein
MEVLLTLRTSLTSLSASPALSATRESSQLLRTCALRLGPLDIPGLSFFLIMAESPVDNIAYE